MTPDVQRCALLLRQTAKMIDQLWQDAVEQGVDSAGDLAQASYALHRALVYIDSVSVARPGASGPSEIVTG